MAKKRDYYDLLGVDRGATTDDIRSAYRKLARTLHPDVNKDKDASKKFSEVQEAYDILSDDEKRKAYDRFGHAGVGAGASGAGGAGPGYGPGGAQWSYSTGGQGGATEEDIGSIFEQMFSGGSPFGGAASGRARSQRAQPRPRRGRDLSHSLTVAFDTAATGGTQQIRLSSAGSVQTIDVKIPAGIESGAKLRVRGRGEPEPTPGGKAGDLILTIDVAPHPYFRRDGLNIFIDVPITIAEAALGVTVSVPLLSGSVELKIPPGTSSGQKLRITGKGITNAKGRSGDQFAVVQIIAPRDLTERAIDLLNDLSKELKNPRDSGPWAGSSG